MLKKHSNAFVEIVGGELGKGGKVQLVGFGTFEVTERAAKLVEPSERKRDFHSGLQST